MGIKCYKTNDKIMNRFLNGLVFNIACKTGKYKRLHRVAASAIMFLINRGALIEMMWPPARQTDGYSYQSITEFDAWTDETLEGVTRLNAEFEKESD